MTKAEFLHALEDSLEVDRGALKGDQILEDLECWDSMSALLYMALADEKLQVAITGGMVMSCKTINDLVGLLGDKLTA